ncbi:peptide ABC transporter substrate-binding protein [Kurthia huakuii]|uniref:peptide ABC transporter substrate-binding protein n=1 Tax=Kurthia huakuii TaxID=1421019 RepID=UPI000495EBEC|nr:peptide ABC transporter substrate-binding protein [Kurthia huakuii]MBM7699582.1 oligopeptide transport system substrate-binding protein [Kurthia huakuii]
MKKRLLPLLLLVLIMSVLAACNFGGDSKEDSSKKESGEKAQELNVSIMSEPPTLNPQMATDATSGTVIKNVFEGLTRVGKDGKPENAAAEDVQVSDDKLTYTFKLRDAKWSNGDAVVAEDFAYAWKWALDPKNASEYSSILYAIRGAQDFNEGKGKVEDVGIEVVDDKTLKVTLTNPTPYFLELTAFYTYMPVNHKVVEKNDKWFADASADFVTNGAFELSEWKHNDKIVLAKSDSYWDKDNVSLDNVNIQMIESQATANRMFTNGDIDFIGGDFQAIPLDAIEGYKKDKSLQVKDFAAEYWYKVNTTAKYVDNANIRKALALSINRQGLIDNVLKADQKPALGMVPPAIQNYDEKAYFKDNDIEGAKKALAEGMKELGIKDAKDIKIGISINTSEAHAAIAQYIQEGWHKNLGIEVAIDNSEWQVYLDKLSAKEYDLGRQGWIADFNDPYTFLEMFTSADNGNNDTGWEDPEYKKLMGKIVKETDTEKRLAYLQQAEDIAMKQFPVIPVYYYTTTYVKKDYVKNMDPNLMGFIDLKWVSVEK